MNSCNTSDDSEGQTEPSTAENRRSRRRGPGAFPGGESAESTFSTRRRSLLAALGAAGVGGLLGTGSAGAQVGGTPTEPGASAGGGGEIRNVESAVNGTIRVVSEGSFVDPSFGQDVAFVAEGSGFLVGPDGTAITATHVVNGASNVRAFVGNQQDEAESYAVRLLGVSECSDLAAIQLTGSGFDYFEWYDDEVESQMEVWASGFTLGDQAYTVTDGRVTKPSVDMHTYWASVDDVVGHSATLNPGSSGGPLINDDGEVVGVNYAGIAEADENYAIPWPTAQRITGTLLGGQNVEAIGINGSAIATPDGAFSGIWVYAVQPGSPAYQTGIRGGDLLLELNGEQLAEDGTMRRYCGILRTFGDGATLPVRVLRSSTGQMLTGEINGAQLTQGSLCPYNSYSVFTDQSETLQLEAPTKWFDVDGSASNLGPSLQVAPNVDSYRDSYLTPGVTFLASDSLGASDPSVILDRFTSFGSGCESRGRFPYDDGVYTGQYEVFVDCGESGGRNVNIGAFPPDNSFAVFVNVQLVDGCDEEALDRIVNAFTVVEAL